jgi:actin related protein 2/3 complex subunit 5
MDNRRVSTGFRKIDIDQYGENVFKDDELNSLEGQSPTGVDEQEIKKFLQSGKKAEALRSVLSCAPLNTKNQMVKDRAFDLMQQVLMATKSSEIDKVIENLEPELCDILMKYIYRGFENPSEGSSGHLLIWHEKVFALGGVGSIVRVLTDKKRV